MEARLAAIRESWGFTGLEPVAIVDVNAFGNALVEAADGAYWRVCPEELSCTPVAASKTEFEGLLRSEEFQTDWKMQPMVELAAAHLGKPGLGRCYCLKVPALTPYPRSPLPEFDTR